MYGWIMVMHQLGSASAAYGAGLLHTDIGSYNAAFIGAGGLCMVAALLSLRIGVGRTPRAQRPALATAET
ncbi:MAG: MFS transporter, partial [Stellaceae bacterium]